VSKPRLIFMGGYALAVLAARPAQAEAVALREMPVQKKPVHDWNLAGKTDGPCHPKKSPPIKIGKGNCQKPPRRPRE
jgi:hypothetical protein